MSGLLHGLAAEPATVLYSAVAIGLALALGVWVVVAPGNRVSRERRRFGVAAPENLLTRTTNRATGAIEAVLRRRGGGRSAAGALERAGLSVSAADYVLLSGAGVLVGAIVGYLLGGPLLAVLLALVAVVGSLGFLVVKRSRRESDFADQLDDVVSLLATNLRAGHSLLQSMDGLAREIEEPAKAEITGVVNQVRVGRDLGDALEESAERMNSEDFRWIAQAIAIHRQVGGNLADVLDTVGDTIRERNQIRRQVKALSAEGKLSAYVLMGLPILLAIALSVMNPEYMGRLTESLLGYAMIGACLVLLTVGGLVLRKVVTITF